MAFTAARNNLDVRIALLEASLGISPNIQWCLSAANNPRIHAQIMSMSSDQARRELEDLRRQKVEQKLFWVQRELCRTVKKAKAFHVQKIIKKIKMCKDNNDDGTLAERLEQDLKEAKAVNHQEESRWIYERFILESGANEYVAARLKTVAPNPRQSSVEPSKALVGQKLVKTAIQELLDNLDQFLHKTFHDDRRKVEHCSESEPAKGERCVKEGLVDDTWPTVSKVNSCFVGSLNAKSGRQNNSISKGSPVPFAPVGDTNKKKNRMGQRARRALAEAKFGGRANHLKNNRDSATKQHKGLTHTAAECGEQQSDERIHPSWKAKQEARSRERLVTFQGTKRTFSDD